MIIFQTVGCGCANGFKITAGMLENPDVSATTFRTNDYIHRLNRALQSEMRAYSAYNSLLTHTSDHSELECSAEQHQQSSRDLVRLIIANRGIPEDRAALNLGLTKGLIRLCTMVPTKLTERVSISTLKRVELSLVSQYRRLQKMAPPRDQEDLRRLLKITLEMASKVTGP